MYFVLDEATSSTYAPACRSCRTVSNEIPTTHVGLSERKKRQQTFKHSHKLRFFRYSMSCTVRVRARLEVYAPAGTIPMHSAREAQVRQWKAKLYFRRRNARQHHSGRDRGPTRPVQKRVAPVNVFSVYATYCIRPSNLLANTPPRAEHVTLQAKLTQDCLGAERKEGGKSLWEGEVSSCKHKSSEGSCANSVLTYILVLQRILLRVWSQGSHLTRDFFQYPLR